MLELLYYHGQKRNPYYIMKKLNSLEGLFSYVIRDKNKIYLMQDRMGDYLWLYFTIVDGTLHYSNNFNDMIELIDNPTLDYEAVKQRLISEFTWGDRTLVNEIKKVPLHCMAVFDEEDKTMIYHPLNFDAPDRSKNIVPYYENILPEYPDVEAIAYSAGFDSNMLLYKYHHPDIKLFTVGADKGRDDSVGASIITEALGFKNNLQITKPTCKDLQDFPTLVKICGESWNKGAFTTYLLAKLCKEHNINSILIGEGGNEIFTQVYNKFLYDTSLRWDVTTKGDFGRHVSTSVGMVANHAIKRTGAIFNYFNIEPVFPFLDLNFIKSLEPSDDHYTNQNRYRTRVLDVLPSKAREVIKTQGGSFDLINLVHNEEEIIRYKEFALNSKFYPMWKDACESKGPTKDYVLDWVFNIIYLHLFEEIYVNKKEIKTLDEVIR